MPRRHPALCKTTTATTGTSNYVLSIANQPTPHRTPKQAVAAGALADGDTVHYEVRDTTVNGDAIFERGLGVYTDATNTVARTAGNVLDGTDGPGVLHDWPLSGVRDFYILGVVAERAAYVDIANVFSLLQTLLLGGAAPSLDAATGLHVHTSPAVGSNAIASIGSGTQGYAQLGLGDSGSQLLGRVRYYGSAHATLANVLELWTNGALRVQLNASAMKVTPQIQSSTGNPYENFAGGGATGMIFKQPAAPTGWTKSTADNDAALRIVSGTPGGSAGSRPLSSAFTANYTLEVADIPEHTHDIAARSGGALTGTWVASTQENNSVLVASQSAGGGGPHAHGLDLRYVDAIVCTKN